MPLPVSVILSLAQACAPTVSPGTLAAIVQTESGGDPLAIGVNGSNKAAQLRPSDLSAAVQTTRRLLASGANLDLGLGQINSRNLQALGMSLAEAFDPCRNLRGAGQILSADYARSAAQPGLEQAALRTSLSLYNTGDRQRGFRNGYVAKVTAAARRVVPELRGDATLAAAIVPSTPAPWDVFAATGAATSGFVFHPRTPGEVP